MEEEMREEKLIPNPVKPQVKKAYTKPVINKVQLVVEEAVLALCKTGVKEVCTLHPTCVSTRSS